MSKKGGGRAIGKERQYSGFKAKCSQKKVQVDCGRRSSPLLSFPTVGDGSRRRLPEVLAPLSPFFPPPSPLLPSLGTHHAPYPHLETAARHVWDGRRAGFRCCPPPPPPPWRKQSLLLEVCGERDRRGERGGSRTEAAAALSLFFFRPPPLYTLSLRPCFLFRRSREGGSLTKRMRERYPTDGLQKTPAQDRGRTCAPGVR